MTLTSPLAASALAGLGILMTALGFYVVSQEGASYSLEAGTALKTVAGRSKDDPVGLSIASRTELLRSCETVLRSEKSFELKLMPQITFAALVEDCRRISGTIAASSPMFSLAWAVAADAAARERDWPPMNEYLLNSRNSGPSEEWIARYRLRIADQQLRQLSGPALTAYDQDLRLLIESNKGTPFLARRYVSDAAFRTRLAAALADVGEADQRRFLGTLRRLVPAGTK